MFGRKSKKIKINRDLNQEITRKIMSGQQNISWHWVRSYCNSNFKADEICNFLTAYKGCKIEYQGKVYNNWEVIE